MINVYGIALAALVFLPTDSAREITISRINGVLTATTTNGTDHPVKIRLGNKITNEATGHVYATGTVHGPEINATGTFLIA